MIEILKERYYLDCIEIRRDLHKIPEEGLKEFKTNKYIMNYLNKIGLKCEKSAGTGVICFFDGFCNVCASFGNTQNTSAVCK